MSGEAKFDRSRLATLPAFEGLAGEELRDLLQRARVQKLEKGSALFEQGGAADWFFR